MHRWGFGVKMNGVQMVSNGNFVSMSYGISKQGQENRLGIQHKKKKKKKKMHANKLESNMNM